MAALLVTAALGQSLHPTPAVADTTDGTLMVIVDLDVNGNGEYDDGDRGQRGITVTVTDATGHGTVSDTTDSDGVFQMKPSDVLTGGRYFVLAEIPTTMSDLAPVPESKTFAALSTTADVTSESQTIRMGVVKTAAPPTRSATPEPSPTKTQAPAPKAPAARFTLGDLVWRDLNRNGVQDDGEPPAAGISVQLRSADNDVLKSTKTLPSGHYRFDNLPAGTYAVQFAGLPPNTRLTTTGAGGRDNDSNPDSTGLTTPITLGVGEPGTRAATPADGVRDDYVNFSVDAGVAPLRFAVGDHVWSDLNADGVQQDGEPPATASVNLLDADHKIVATTTTDPQGHYSFTGLGAGSYQVQFVGLPAHRSLTLRGVGGDRTRDSDADPASGMTPVFRLDQRVAELQPVPPSDLGTADYAATAVNAGLVGSYSIGDTVWRDLDGDGVQGPGEHGVPGVRVELSGSAPHAKVIKTVRTQSDGSYTFDHLTAGSYRVKFSHLPTGLVFTGTRQGGDAGVDSDADTTGVTPAITLSDDNPADTSIDAGLTTPGNFSGAVAAGGGVVPAAGTSLSSTGGVSAAIPLAGVALVVAGAVCLLAQRTRRRRPSAKAGRDDRLAA